MKIRIFLFTSIITFLFTNCDCVLQAEGVVLDADSNTLLSDVMISSDLNFKKEVVRSDDNGHFLFSEINGGWKCPDLKLYFQKTGYHLYEKDYSDSERMDTIYLKKQ